ncbi:MAG: hypothetical protein H6652_25645 [Ardenticatenaceae bacterium]|nr:hypothetical protein [Ardenticatenaceae bacterium]MCB8949864.1 hypothetical protein [Ardenticatenaceae bacterium]
MRRPIGDLRALENHELVTAVSPKRRPAVAALLTLSPNRHHLQTIYHTSP